MPSYRPIIIIGMHRSGTSMLAELLRQAGIYMGRRLGRNCEALHFRNLNRWLLQQAGGSWIHPGPFREILADPPSRDLARDYLALKVTGPGALGFWGVRGLFGSPGPWGWKDPRNTFTLPTWLELFPEARVIHMERHGVDVAESLYVRRSRAIRRSREHFRRRRFLYRFVAKRTDLLDAPRLARREEALALWEEYMAAGREQMAGLGDRGLSLAYEDFLQDPADGLARVAEHCDLELSDKRIREMTRELDPQRAFAYRASPELREVAAENADRLAAFGYGP